MNKSIRQSRFLPVGYKNILIPMVPLLVILSSCPVSKAYAQFEDDIPEQVLNYKVALEPESPRAGEYARVVVSLKLHPGWHVYSIIPAEGEFPPIATSMRFLSEGFDQVGPVFESQPVTAFDPVLEQVLSYHEGSGKLFQNLQIPKQLVADETMEISGSIRYQACSDRLCLPPKTENWELAKNLGGGSVRNEYSTPEYSVDLIRIEDSEMESALRGGLWGFLGIAVMAGLLALLTPCVFPMIPITVAFFSKQETSVHANTLRLSVLFGIGIIGTYTITGMGLSATLGAAGAVRFATNGWINLAIGLLFTLFAFSLMGFFQLKLPATFGAHADRWSRTLGGPLGIIAMGLAFTLTSFTCTVQFVGTLMIAAAQGQWFWPLVGMLVFATVFAFPFFLLGLFPRLITSIHSRSGEWMEQLKIILGLLELAAAFKFFSNCDLVWQLGVLDRDFVLIAWTIICGISALFLLGTVTINDTRIRKSGPFGFTTALAFLMLGLYFTRGLGGIDLNPWVDTYLPPSLQGLTSIRAVNTRGSEIPAHSLPWLTDLETALVQAKRENKRVFIDFTGYTCVNCRWMEKNIFSEPRVMDLFLREFILVQLYTDGGEKAEANQQLQFERFKTVALPLYVVLDAENHLLALHAGILEPAKRFLHFLRLEDSS